MAGSSGWEWEAAWAGRPQWSCDTTGERTGTPSLSLSLVGHLPDRVIEGEYSRGYAGRDPGADRRSARLEPRAPGRGPRAGCGASLLGGEPPGSDSGRGTVGVDQPDGQGARRGLLIGVAPPDWRSLRVVLNDRAAIYAEQFPQALAAVGSAMLEYFDHDEAQDLLFTFAGAWPGLGRDDAVPTTRFVYRAFGDVVCRFRGVELAPGAIVVDDVTRL